ncbi:gluconokinase, GntK/IdnK-type [Chryseobacterium sp.]|uniref:gluconokinase, GntK/IdnK-type n=1 Tax=Chryseobacterium sp. TaxID=1871047 RepID=UPI0025BE998E|nr:gluconokinase, GntK/IdnK-type [Chryseobacterium sp.]
MIEKQNYSFVFMGVSGSGKSSVAEAVAKKLNVPFLDGDFLHPRANIEKMALGLPLNDEDRIPWLQTLNSAIYAMQRTHAISILVCSALKQTYRNMLREGNEGLYFIYLQGNFDVIAERLKNRNGHFFKAEMLKSQFDALEEPVNDHNDIGYISIDKPLEQTIEDALDFINGVLNKK